MPPGTPITVHREHSMPAGWQPSTAATGHSPDFQALLATLTEAGEDLLEAANHHGGTNGQTNGQGNGHTNGHGAPKQRVRVTIEGRRNLTLTPVHDTAGRAMLRVRTTDAEGDHASRDWPEGAHAAIAFSCHWLTAWAAWAHLEPARDHQGNVIRDRQEEVALSPA